jgi:adenine specific DNA methylase Mod
MPTLNWIGKEAVVNHDKEVPFRLLKKVKSSSIGENSQNLIIHGDNLEALKALMPYYQNKIKCIYIDPPYNTGNEGWVYNDKVNSPKIKKWLGKVVGGESEDLCRHDKWLCMMYPRIKLLKELLTEDGAIFISIDDNEHCGLKIILDEIFGEDNFVSTIIWEKSDSPRMDVSFFSSRHDFILLYAKNKDQFKLTKVLEEEIPEHYSKTDEKGRLYYTKPLRVMGGHESESLYFPLIAPDGTKVYPIKPNGDKGCWRWSKKKVEEEKERIEWVNGKKGWVPYFKIYAENRRPTPPETIWFFSEVGSNRNSKNELRQLFEKEIFDTPKPINLIKKIIQISTSKDDFILDSFAGSGTTGHAVMELNKIDKGNRKFILIEMEDKVAKEVTAERIKKAIKRDDYNEGFEYCELDKPLFNEEGQIEEECSFEQLATYIYFTETNTNLDKKEISGKFVGEYNDVEYYLLFKEKGKNILSKDFLKKIKDKTKKKVIYADKCLIDDKTLIRYNIQFKQIPYEVKVY